MRTFPVAVAAALLLGSLAGAFAANLALQGPDAGVPVALTDASHTASPGSGAPGADGVDAGPRAGAAGVPTLFTQGPDGLSATSMQASARFDAGAVHFTSAAAAWSLVLEGAPDAAPVADGAAAGVANWYLGNDPAQWQVGLPILAGVRYDQAWPGIDIAFHDAAGSLKYDVLLAPGTSATAARFTVQGASHVALEADGSLAIGLGDATVVRQPAPYAYQETASGRVQVPAAFHLDGFSFGFLLGPHDPTRPVVIDPALEYASYLAGSGTDVAWAVAVDEDGAMYVTGESQSPALFPSGTPGHRPSLSWTTDHNHEATNIFVAKVAPDGLSYEWGTFIGGSNTPEPDTAYALALAPGGHVFLTGYTHSWDFPANLTSYQPALRSVAGSGQLTVDRSHDFYDAFVADVGPAGQLHFATFLGGGGEDFGYAIDIDERNGDVVVAGETTSLDFPVTATAYQKTGQGGGNLEKNTWTFVTRFVSFGNGLSDVGASTILGSYAHVATYDLDLDASGRPWFVGYKYVADRPVATPGAPDYVPFTNGTKNLFVAAFEPDLDKLHYAARLGGNADDRAFGIKVVGGLDGAEPLVYVTGQSASSNLPVTDGSKPGGNSDVFVLKLDPGRPAGQHIVYFTQVGGRDADVGRAIEVDGDGQVYVAGHTGSTRYFAPRWPTTDGTGGTLAACQAETARGQEAILLVLDAGGKVRYSTYFGGRGHDAAEELALAPDGTVVIVGQTSSPNLPTTQGALGTSLAAGKDAFMARIDIEGGAGCPATPTVLPDPCLTWQPPKSVTILYNAQKTLPVSYTSCGRTLNSGVAGEPKHYLFWAIYSNGTNGHWEWDSGTNPATLKGAGQVTNGATGSANVTVSTKKCWNGTINQVPPCDPGSYYILWDIVEANPSDPLIPNTLFTQQGVKQGRTDLTISLV